MVSAFVHSSKEVGAIIYNYCSQTWRILSLGIIDSAGKKKEKIRCHVVPDFPVQDHI